VAERLRLRIEQIKIPEFGNLTTSIGIATFPLHATSRIELFRAADDALYTAKRAGRNRVVLAETPAEAPDSIPLSSDNQTATDVSGEHVM
jgi:PleD family two-component response regulator